MALSAGSGGIVAAENRAAASPAVADMKLDAATAPTPGFQEEIATIEREVRARYGLAEAQSAVGVLDLKTGRLALVRPDEIFYAASVPKIAILLAWFELNSDWPAKLDAETRHELGLMIKVSDNAMAAKYSEQLGLKPIQAVLDRIGFYDPAHGGGIWVGKHYGKGTERYVDPVGGHSHAATVRQLLRYYLMLEQGRLVSPAAAQTMREIFASPDIAHRNDKFVLGLAGRDRQVLRKAGWWEDWYHDTAIVSGPGVHYIVVALTHHVEGDDFLAAFAAAVDNRLR